MYSAFHSNRFMTLNDLLLYVFQIIYTLNPQCGVSYAYRFICARVGLRCLTTSQYQKLVVLFLRKKTLKISEWIFRVLMITPELLFSLL
jgi:hypothetical protein